VSGGDGPERRRGSGSGVRRGSKRAVVGADAANAGAVPIEAGRRHYRWRSSQAAPSRGLIEVNAARFGWA
jgi:hypothetical protein